MGEASFRKLVSFKHNYRSKALTDKQIRDEFKSVFSNGDDSNNVFFDSCSMEDLQDLCSCFELYLARYPEAELRDLGIAKYINGKEKYFLFTTSEVITNVITKEIIGVNEEVVQLFQIRNVGTDMKQVKGFIDSTVITKVEREDKENHPGNLTKKMFRMMINNECNVDKNSSTMVCKSKLRVLMCNYMIVSNLIEKAKERNANNSEEALAFIQKLKTYKKHIQENLALLALDIEKKYHIEEEAEIPFATKLTEFEEESEIVFDTKTNFNGSPIENDEVSRKIANDYEGDSKSCTAIKEEEQSYSSEENLAATKKRNQIRFDKNRYIDFWFDK